MSATTDGWIELYSAQTERDGVKTVTVEGVATSKPCIPSETPWNRVNAFDGGGKEWDETREAQMLVSDLAEALYQFASVSFSDDARPAQLESWKINNGIAYLTVKFIGTGQEAGSEVNMAGDETTYAGAT